MGHHLDEFQKCLPATQSGIPLPFLSHAGDMTMLIVVGWIHEGIVRKDENLAVDRTIKGLGASILEVGASASVDEQRVAREYACLASVLKKVAMVRVGMPWCEERPEREAPYGHWLPFSYAYVRAGKPFHGRICDLATGQ